MAIFDLEDPDTGVSISVEMDRAPTQEEALSFLDQARDLKPGESTEIGGPLAPEPERKIAALEFEESEVTPIVADLREPADPEKIAADIAGTALLGGALTQAPIPQKETSLKDLGLIEPVGAITVKNIIASAERFGKSLLEIAKATPGPGEAQFLVDPTVAKEPLAVEDAFGVFDPFSAIGRQFFAPILADSLHITMTTLGTIHTYKDELVMNRNVSQYS